MTGRLTSFLDTLSDRRAVRRWARAAAQADLLDLRTLNSLRGRARQARREIERLLHAAEARLAGAVAGDIGPRPPLHGDWAWRPDVWRGPVRPAGHVAAESRTALAPGVTVFHDCAQSELTVRQIRNKDSGAAATFGLRLDVLRFDGSFLSLVVDIPEDVARSMKLRHVVRLDLAVEVERSIEIFARINLRHGPNTEQIVCELSLPAGEPMVEFDLACTRMNEKRVEKAWIDLIFEGPAFNQVVLRDLVLSRSPRAEI